MTLGNGGGLDSIDPKDEMDCWMPARLENLAIFSRPDYDGSMITILISCLLVAPAHGKTRWWYSYKGHPPTIVVAPHYCQKPKPRVTYYTPRLPVVKRPMGAVYQRYVEPLEILNPWVQ
jgi:hypothetical protein